MSTAIVSYALARLGTETRGIPRSAGHVGRIYVLTTEEVAAALDELGTQACVVVHEGLRSHIVSGTSRPARRLVFCLRRRQVGCGDVERTELSLANGVAHLDHELGTDRVVVRTWSPRDGSELDQALWWHGHAVVARAGSPDLWR